MDPPNLSRQSRYWGVSPRRQRNPGTYPRGDPEGRSRDRVHNFSDAIQAFRAATSWHFGCLPIAAFGWRSVFISDSTNQIMNIFQLAIGGLRSCCIGSGPSPRLGQRPEIPQRVRILVIVIVRALGAVRRLGLNWSRTSVKQRCWDFWLK